MKKFLAVLFVLTLIAPLALALDPVQIKVVTYNTMDYPATTADRGPAFKTVLDALNPDILVFQRVKSVAMLDSLKNTYLDPKFARSDSLEIDKNEFALLYDESKFELMESFGFPNADRPMIMWKLRPKMRDDAPWLNVMTCRLNTESNPIRKTQIDSMKILLAPNYDPNGYYILAGDVHGVKSTESGYKALLSDTTLAPDTLFYDPINEPGTWTDDSTRPWIHTQSTHVSQKGGYASGGLDDRWDQILISKKFNSGEINSWSYVTDSYMAYGNDGQYLNDSLNNPTKVNAKVSAEMVAALYLASDRLPVVAEFRILDAEDTTDVVATNPVPNKFDLLSAYPNPFNGTVSFNFALTAAANTKLAVFDANGRMVTELVNGNLTTGSHSVEWKADGVAAGSYFARLTVDGKTQSLKVTYLK